MIVRVEEELGWEFMNGYGLTEAAPLLTITRAPAEWDALETGDRAALLARQGMAAVGVRLRVDPQGEVLARSNHVLESYWDDPDASAAALAGGWLRTGDGGVLDADQHLVITDRKKDVIVTGAENVSSIEVEDCLHGHPDVVDVAVIGVPHERWGETVLALVVRRDGSEVQASDVIGFARERLTGFKCPTAVEFRDALPRTATGKIQKFKLRAPYWTEQAPLGREA
jgi:acyl-CoA synthetase (AMP-forming)/AMP-acid ligase II